MNLLTVSYPPIKNGTRVKATVRRSITEYSPTASSRKASDYTDEAIAMRALCDRQIGLVCEHHDSHRLCYGVEFRLISNNAKVTAFFDPDELEILP